MEQFKHIFFATSKSINRDSYSVRAQTIARVEQVALCYQMLFYLEGLIT